VGRAGGEPGRGAEGLGGAGERGEPSGSVRRAAVPGRAPRRDGGEGRVSLLGVRERSGLRDIQAPPGKGLSETAF